MHFETLLKSHGLKTTPQRLVLLQQIGDAGHIGIEALFESIKRTFPSLSLATVYKNITSMVDSGLLTEVKLPGRKQQYELCKTPHSHVVCDLCEKVMDVEHPMEGLIAETEARSGFKLHTASLVLSGCCPECQRHAS